MMPQLFPARPFRIAFGRRFATEGEGRWVQIGAKLGADGKKHGGSPAFVEGGKITKGPAALVGRGKGEGGKKGPEKPAGKPELPADPMILKAEIIAGRARTPKDRAIIDLQNAHERLEGLKTRGHMGRKEGYDHEQAVKKAEREKKRAEKAYLAAAGGGEEPTAEPAGKPAAGAPAVPQPKAAGKRGEYAHEWLAQAVKLTPSQSPASELNFVTNRVPVSRFEGRESVNVDMPLLAGSGAERNRRMMILLGHLWEGYKDSPEFDPASHKPDTWRDGVHIDRAFADWAGIPHQEGTPREHPVKPLLKKPAGKPAAGAPEVAQVRPGAGGVGIRLEMPETEEQAARRRAAEEDKRQRQEKDSRKRRRQEAAARNVVPDDPEANRIADELHAQHLKRAQGMTDPLERQASYDRYKDELKKAGIVPGATGYGFAKGKKPAGKPAAGAPEVPQPKAAKKGPEEGTPSDLAITTRKDKHFGAIHSVGGKEFASREQAEEYVKDKQTGRGPDDAEWWANAPVKEREAWAQRNVPGWLSMGNRAQNDWMREKNATASVLWWQIKDRRGREAAEKERQASEERKQRRKEVYKQAAKYKPERSYKAGTFRVSNGSDPATEVQGVGDKGLFAHKAEHGWRISHTGSGLGLGGAYPSKGAAMMAMDRLYQTGVDWTRPAKELENAAVRQAAQAMDLTAPMPKAGSATFATRRGPFRISFTR